MSSNINIRRFLATTAIVGLTGISPLIGVNSASAAPSTNQVVSANSAAANTLHRLFATNGCARIEGNFWMLNSSTVRVSFSITAKGMRGGSKATFRVTTSYLDGELRVEKKSDQSATIFNKYGTFEGDFPAGSYLILKIDDVELHKGAWANCDGPSVVASI